MSDNDLVRADADEGVVSVFESSSAALNKSEVEAQLDAAHRYKRSITRFRQEALTLATLSEEIAASCIYAIPRDGKTISGPSVRLAEICASAYGNLHVAARVVAVEEKDVVAQGGAWDLEKNLRVTVETRRKIVGKRGRFNDDMINLTGNAAASIALRNAIFRVIPRAYVDSLYEQVRKVAVGDAKTLATKRAQVLERLGKMGASQDRILASLGKAGIEDIGLEDLERLIGLGTSMKDGNVTVDQAFPPPIKPEDRPTSLDALAAKSKETKKQIKIEIVKEPEPAGEGRCQSGTCGVCSWCVASAPSEKDA